MRFKAKGSREAKADALAEERRKAREPFRGGDVRKFTPGAVSVFDPKFADLGKRYVPQAEIFYKKVKEMFVEGLFGAPVAEAVEKLRAASVPLRNIEGYEDRAIIYMEDGSMIQVKDDKKVTPTERRLV